MARQPTHRARRRSVVVGPVTRTDWLMVGLAVCVFLFVACCVFLLVFLFLP